MFEVLLYYTAANYSVFLNVQPNDSVKWPYVRFKSCQNDNTAARTFPVRIFKGVVMV